LTILTAFSLLSACGDGDLEEITDRGYAYFPLRTGAYQIYDVTEITYSSLSDPDTAIYQLRTEVIDSFVNTAGSYNYVIHRSTRLEDSDEWEFRDTWSARIEGEQAIVAEGNVPFVKLAFPLAEGLIWNGNKYNAFEEDEYQVSAMNVSLTVASQLFEHVVIVEQEDYNDEVTKTDQRTEVYADNIGLVQKEKRVLNYCTDPICLNDQIIESGTYYKQEIRDYGVK
jgi:hypothetical protein